MIQKLLKIGGIGLLHEAIKIPVQFSRFNILYGENGRGKTTLTSILRSLETNNPADIEERKTINGQHAPEVELLVDGQCRTYKAGRWNLAGARLLVFDARFVDQNVYSGAVVEPDHRKNLHYFAIGEHGVKLAKQVDTLAQQITTATNNVNNAEAAVAEKMPDRSIGVQEFLTLDPLDNVDRTIEEKQKYINALQQSNTVAQLKLPTQLPIETISSKDVAGVLKLSFEGISKQVENLVRAHIAEAAPSEGWIELGVSRMTQKCPFCGRDNEAVPLVEAYKSYFGEEYRNHKSNIDTAIKHIRETLSSESATKLVNWVLSNSSILAQWSSFMPFDPPSLDTPKLVVTFEALRIGLEELLAAKQASPLETYDLSPTCDKLFAEYQTRMAELAEYNKQLAVLITSCERFKTRLAAGDIKDAQRDLLDAQGRRTRHTPEVMQLCTAYKQARKAKQKLVEQKDEAKRKLEEYTTTLLAKYQDTINDYITRCGGNFKITGMSTAYPGGLPRVDYCIKLFGEEIDLTNKKPNKIGFKTAMGQGDKNTLAFAFFLARLEHATDLTESTVVFDDPLSSFDSSRRQFTRAQLLRVVQKCKQLLVFTHDEDTAARLAKEAPVKALPASERTYWEFRTVGNYTELHPLDISTIAKLPYVKNREVLDKFMKQGADRKEHDSIIRAIRPCLEDILKYRFHDELRSDATLGQIIKQIRESSAPQHIHDLLPRLADLEQIDAYATQHSHGDEAPAEEIDAMELRAHVALALEIMRGLPAARAAKLP